MKKGIVFVAAICCGLFSQGQLSVLSNSLLQQIENQMGSAERQYDKEDLLRKLDIYSIHPLNLNTAGQEDLKSLLYLNDAQIENFLLYRKVFGPLVSKYELQAVPGWDIATISAILPFIVIGDSKSRKAGVEDYLTKGNSSILYRMGRSLNLTTDFKKDSTGHSLFAGSPYHLFLRYRYSYENRFEWQWLGDKDAGEQMFRGNNRYGFDFNSFHFSLKNTGIVKLAVVGDFMVNMGQGLIQWQSIALTKSADITAVKRQSATIGPYTSSGETNFFRGAGLTMGRKNWEGSFFLSRRLISAHIDRDSGSDEGHVTSIISSGYHRTQAEQQQKNNVKQLSAGGSIGYKTPHGDISFNVVMHHLSLPIEKEPLPYNLFSIRGSDFFNTSVAFSHTEKNAHFFGEVAADKYASFSMLSGAMISLASSLDLSIVGRAMSRSYQSLYASAFSENETPANERGVYTGLLLRGPPGITFQGYIDYYHFPWLKFRVNTPSSGREVSLIAKYLPDRKTEFTVRYKAENKSGNRAGEATIPGVIPHVKAGLQIQSTLSLWDALIIRARLETARYKEAPEPVKEGFLFLTDLGYKPSRSAFSMDVRLQYFDADSYDARIYAYENVMAYSFGFPAFYKKGYRSYLNLHYNFTHSFQRMRLSGGRVEAWLRLAGTFYTRNSPTPPLDDTDVKRQLDIQMQLLAGF